MKILTNNFYKFLFGFITIIFFSLILIFVTGVLENNSERANLESIAGECEEGSISC